MCEWLDMPNIEELEKELNKGTIADGNIIDIANQLIRCFWQMIITYEKI